jgi:hypothetical protein
MFQDQVSIKVKQEIQDKTKAFTNQFLQVHDVVRIDGRPKIERIDTDQEDGVVVAYVSVKDEPFYFALYFDNRESLSVIGAGTEPHNTVCFRATSRELNADELKALTSLEATNRWTKGQKEKEGVGFHSYSQIEIEPNPEVDDVMDKIRKLLDALEKDREGIKKLVDSAFGRIHVNMRFHNGNKMLFGAPKLDNKIIRRLSELDLSIAFELYAEGNFFKEK